MTHIQPICHALPVRQAIIRFSLFLLLLFVTVLCIALAWWLRPRYVVAETLFHVSRRQPAIIGELSFNEREYELLQKSQLTLLKSNFVLQAAARHLRTGTLPAFQSTSDTAEWLLEHLEVEFSENSEILAIRLRGTEAQATNLVQVVDAVAKAYEEEMVHKERVQRLRAKEVKSLIVKDLRQKIEKAMLAQEATPTESADDRVHRELNQMELDVLVQLWRDMQKSLKIDEVNMGAPEQVTPIQTATIRPE